MELQWVRSAPSDRLAWDGLGSLRPGSDSTGYIQRILKEMPVANNWATAVGNPNR